MTKNELQDRLIEAEILQNDKENTWLLKEANELISIFVASIRTLRKNQK